LRTQENSARLWGSAVIDIKGIIEATEGVCSGASDAEVLGVSIDTRTLKAGDIFFAVKGPNFDGHKFIAEAFGKGAVAVVAQKGTEVKGGPVISVEDTVRALGDLAAYMRKAFKIPLVAVAGSTGKTTTKEMIAAILSRDRAVLKTEGNKNNIIGLPLTLTGLRAEHSAAVVELGISAPGEMERLVEISSPDVALITNIGRAHIENFSGIEAISVEKGFLYRLAGPRSTKVVNIDDPLAVIASGFDSSRRRGMEYVTFSAERVADVRVLRSKRLDGLAGVLVTFDVRGQVFDVRLKVPGLFNVSNALAAIAAVLPLGVYLDDIREGLGAYAGLGGRMEVSRLGWITLLDDTYNANPDSLGVALETLEGARGRRVAVIGDMAELGKASPEAHRNGGRRAAMLGIDIVVAVGEGAKLVVAGAMDGGMRVESMFAFKDKKAALTALRGHILKEGDVVLVKGSRAAGLEFITEGLKRGGAASHEACG